MQFLAHQPVTAKGDKASPALLEVLQTLLRNLGGKAALQHTHEAMDISDSGATGRAVLASADQTAARAALGLGTLAVQNANAVQVSSLTVTGTEYLFQPAPTVVAGAATLTIAQLLTGIVNYTGAAANLTLPTGTAIDGGVLASLPVDTAFQFSVINTGTGAATLVVNTGVKALGSLVVANGTSGTFWVRKTAANTFVVYRI